MPIIITTIISFIAGIAIVIGGLGATDNLGSRGTMYQLNQFRSTSTPYSAITTNVSGKNLYMPDSTATTGIMYADTICLTGDTCETTWSAGGSQTPWTSDIDGGGYNLTNVDYITATGTAATSSFTAISIGTTTHAYALNVDGAIQTDTAFYGDYWKSSTGNSMAIQPTGDTDDFFSFKTPAHRPTIKREGGKFIYLESSNVYDVGISARVDDTYSGTLNYEKDNHMMTMLGKNSPLGFKANSDYDDYVKIQTASNIPEMTVASSSGFKINAGGTNDLLLNHDGGNVGIGTTSTGYILGLGTGDTFGIGTTQWNSADEIDGTKIKDADYGDVVIDAAGDWQVSEASDLNCTNCINATEIEDIYLLNSGDTSTGVQIFNENVEMQNDKKFYFDTAKTYYAMYDNGLDIFRIGSDPDVDEVSELLFSDNNGITLDTYWGVENTINLRATDGGYTDYFAKLSTNYLDHADKDFEFPDVSGTFITSGNLSDITTVGTIGAGTWNGTAITNTYIASSTEFLVDNNTTYTGGDFLTLTATDFDVDATTTISNGDTTHLASVDTIYDWAVGLFQTILTNSAGLLAALDDETGTGVAVFNTSPTLVTPALGTPSALVGTNITGTGASFTAGNVTTNANLTGEVTSTGNASLVADNIIDEANLKVNTATDDYVLTASSTASGGLAWAVLTGGGDVTDVFDCTTGDCNTMTVGTSEYLTYGTGYIDANRFAGVTTVDGTEFGYLNGVTSGIQTQLDAKSASFSTLAALNALIGETVASTTHVWADAYVNNDITIDLATLASSATALANARTIAGVSFDGSANIDIPSTGLSDTADLLYEAELNTFSELQTQIADETLLKAGTLTDTKYCIYDSASTDIICNSSGGSGVALGDSPSWTGAHDWKYAGTPVDIQNTTDAASNQVAIFRAGNRATPADNDQGYLSFYGDNDAGTQEEFGRLTWEMDDVSSTTKDSTLRFWTQTGNTMDSGMYLTGDNLSLDGNLNIGNNIISSTGHLSVNDYINVNGSSYVNTYIQNILSSAKLNISSSDSGIPANRSGALLNLGKGRWSEASSGNHPLIAGIAISPTTIDAGSATVSDTASLYIEGAATTTTVSGNNYSLWVDDIGGGGKSYIDGTLTLGNALPVGSGGTGATTLTDHGVLVGSGTSATTPLTVGTNGQILIGSTGADPVFATLNCDNALTCTTGAGTLEIDVDDSFLKNDGDTGTGTYNMSGATIKQHIYPTFMWLGVATTTTATTTVNIGTAYTAQQWNGMDCKVTSGSAAIIFSDCTNKMNGATATTTYNRTTLSTNNTFTAGESRCIDIGALTDAYPICTMDITINN